ncbi:MAG: methylenetetrahydrofolate reductase, partial [Trichodesmium sp. MAG_R03]|nr:methylenetetrahydrofolate reductase [Trichodesmium sp. MAG_R03]
MNRFRNAVKSGEFLITAEVAPPKGAEPTHMIQMAETLKGRVHAVNITDGSRAVLRMSSLAASMILKNVGIE